MPSENYGATDNDISANENQGLAIGLVDVAQSLTEPDVGREDAGEIPVKPKGERLNHKKKLLLFLIAMTNVFHMAAYSLLAPYFPQEAKVRGISSTVTGLIFSIFMFVSFVISPVYGSYVSTIGINFMLSAGLSVGGACAILFGVLQYCPKGSSFIVLCLLTRTLEALGLTAFSTASFTLVTSQFTNIVTTVFGLLVTAKNVGFMLGPAFGGALYSVGGFGLPFYATGACLVLNGLLLCVLLRVLLPKTENASELAISLETKKAKYRLLRSCTFCLVLASVCLNCLSIGFIDANLELHLEPGATKLVTNTRQHLGRGDEGGKELAFAFVNTASHIRVFEEEVGSLWPCLVGLCLAGIAEAFINIPSVRCMLEGARTQGYPDDVETYGLVSGLYQSANSLGAFMGPFIGGLLTEKTSFTIAASIFSGMFMLKALILLSYFGVKRMIDQDRIQIKHTLSP